MELIFLVQAVAKRPDKVFHANAVSEGTTSQNPFEK